MESPIWGLPFWGSSSVGTPTPSWSGDQEVFGLLGLGPSSLGNPCLGNSQSKDISSGKPKNLGANHSEKPRLETPLSCSPLSGTSQFWGPPGLGKPQSGETPVWGTNFLGNQQIWEGTLRLGNPCFGEPPI